jgi:hypothetical protein
VQCSVYGARMSETPQIDHLAESDAPAAPADPTQAPKLETPVIQMQDVEHQARAATRVNTKGVKVTPRLDSGDQRDFAREDEDAIRALEQIEKSLRGQLPG